MAEVVLELALNQVAIFIKNEFNLYHKSKKEAEDLVQNLEKIKLILNDAESKQLRNPVIKLWLEQLQNFAYDVEDAFERFEAVKNYRAPPQRDESVFKKVRVFTKSIYSQSKGVIKHRGVALEIKDLNERINEIYYKGSNELQLIIHTRSSESQKKPHPNDRITTSRFIESKVHGREKDNKIVKDMLMSLRNKEYKTIPVVSVVGAGGLGKTTLAKMVYKKLESNFSKRIWICVSDPFDQITVAKQILEQLKIPSLNISSLEELTELIHTSLKDSKFLLVLDDVWIDEPKMWEPFNACLSPGVKGSAVLVTTRKVTTARVFHCDDEFIHNLEQVSSEVCWSIISNQLVSSSFRGMDPQREAIGKEIAEKCAGSPLAAKVLGGILLNKESVQDWKRVLYSEIWELEKVEENLFHQFFLSYDELDPAAKKMFLILCSVSQGFPNKRRRLD